MMFGQVLLSWFWEIILNQPSMTLHRHYVSISANKIFLFVFSNLLFFCFNYFQFIIVWVHKFCMQSNHTHIINKYSQRNKNTIVRKQLNTLASRYEHLIQKFVYDYCEDSVQKCIIQFLIFWPEIVLNGNDLNKCVWKCKLFVVKLVRRSYLIKKLDNY